MNYIYYHLDGYIAEIKTLPDLHVTAAHPELISEFDCLIQMIGEDAVCLLYDTTFEMGDYYISTLAFKHFMFKSWPVIPLSYMIHERRKQNCHEAHFSGKKFIDYKEASSSSNRMRTRDCEWFLSQLTYFSLLEPYSKGCKEKGCISKEIRFYKDEVKCCCNVNQKMSI